MINLVKGQKIDLTKKTQLKRINVGLGWDAVEGKGEAVDCDASCVCLGANGMMVSQQVPQSVVYFGNTKLYGIRHSGDNRTGAGEGDDETIEIDLTDIPSSVQKIVVFMNIYKGDEKGQSLAALKNAYIRLYNPDSNEEICKFNMDDTSPTATGMIAGEIYRNDGEWKFAAVGEALKDASYVGTILKRFGYQG